MSETLTSKEKTKRAPHREPLSPVPSAIIGLRRVPFGFGTQEVTPEQLKALELVAVETFTSMVNQGHTFQAALTAVYFSGFTHALETSDEMHRAA